MSYNVKSKDHCHEVIDLETGKIVYSSSVKGVAHEICSILNGNSKPVNIRDMRFPKHENS